MSQDKKLSLIIYDRLGPPRYYRIGKGVFKTVLLGLPFITMMALSALVIIFFYMDHLTEIAKRKEPEKISELNVQLADLHKTNKELEKLNLNLQHRLATPAQSGSLLSTLALFKSPKGQTDASNTNILRLEKADAVRENNKVYFRFNIVNTSKENEKFYGHIFVLMKDNNQIKVWPKNSFLSKEIQIQYNLGEYFATSRFRPVQAEFVSDNRSEYNPFKVVIFNRSGDLVHVEKYSLKVARSE